MLPTLPAYGCCERCGIWYVALQRLQCRQFVAVLPVHGCIQWFALCILLLALLVGGVAVDAGRMVCMPTIVPRASQHHNILVTGSMSLVAVAHSLCFRGAPRLMALMLWSSWRRGDD
jgi:hypothetical protein